MGLGALLLGVFALICMFAGAVMFMVPFVGTMLSFLAPVIAIAGVVIGGVAVSRAKQMGESDGLAIAGLAINVVAFVPAMVVAMTCGLCNTICTGVMLTPDDPNSPPFWLHDGGGGPSPFDLLFPDAGPVPGSAPPPRPAFPPPPPPSGPGAPPSPALVPSPSDTPQPRAPSDTPQPSAPSSPQQRAPSDTPQPRAPSDAPQRQRPSPGDTR